ncbi:MAG: DUF421 domain-containing protein [Oscillospiraceae bacterium]|nr:DUF421 domain-containing protein [Oscillospiraceae bacterium]
MSIIFLRTILLYIVIVFSLRVMGKRQIGELSPTEFVITILISNIATLPIEDSNLPLTAGIIPIFTLVAFEVIISALILKFDCMRRLVSGSPRVVIRDGVINQRELRRLRLSLEDLIEQLRTGGCFNIADVAFAIVETTGQLSVYQKFSARTATNSGLGLSPPSSADAPPAVIISDGKLQKDSLQYCNLRREWLDKVLAEHHCRAQDVFLMTCDRAASYTLVLKEGRQK